MFCDGCLRVFLAREGGQARCPHCRAAVVREQIEQGAHVAQQITFVRADALPVDPGSAGSTRPAGTALPAGRAGPADHLSQADLLQLAIRFAHTMGLATVWVCLSWLIPEVWLGVFLVLILSFFGCLLPAPRIVERGELNLLAYQQVLQVLGMLIFFTFVRWYGFLYKNPPTHTEPWFWEL